MKKFSSSYIYSYQYRVMDPFHYYDEYRVLVCKSCQHGIQPDYIAAHLRGEQHRLTRQQSNDVAVQYVNANLANPGTEVVVPNDIVLPIDHLPIYRDGLACKRCNYVCRSLAVIKRHQREVHHERIGRGRRPEVIAWETAWCQCFFTSIGQRYFRVRQTTEADDQPGYADKLRQLVHRQLDEKEEEEEEKRRIVRESDEGTEVSAWLDRTEWIRHLEGQDKSDIAQLVKPAQQEEQELQEVEKSVVRLVEQARQTILQKKVSIFALQRLESFQPGQDAQKPFHANLGMDTIQRYQRVWKQLLVYVLRTADTESQRYQCTKEQQDSIQSVRIAVENFREDSSEAMQQEVDKYCLQLSVTLLAQRLTHDEYESAIVSFLAVMGLENILGTSRYQFKNSAQYTPILSGFIKMAQMLTLQYCFQQEEDEKTESCYELLEQLHSQFLTVSTATPMDWALRLRLYGRGISKRMTMAGCINWIGDTVVYEDIELSMTDFRILAHKLSEETQCMLHELLFVKDASELPAYSWTELKDNAAKDEPGWNFIQDKRNRMLENRRWLLNRVLQRKELRAEFMNGTGVWRQRRVKDWCDKHVELLEKLLILIHMTGGQPARARELLSIRYCNTEKGGHRSIFIENGLMVVVTYYHKSYNITGTEKIIHRYLLEEVGDILLQYIWLVLPLRQLFDKVVFQKEGIRSSFLWTSDWGGRKWDGAGMREVLKRESDRVIGIKLHKQAYRHIAIAISDRYMKRKFDRDDEKREKGEDEQQDDALARQSTHSPQTAGSVYARSLQEAPSHVQSMQYRFRTASIEWHAVLEFSERLKTETGVRRRLGGDVGELLGIKRGSTEEHEKSPGPRIRRWQSLRQTNLLQALQQLLGADKQFRGKQQAALRAIMDGKSPVIVVMRTGGGKSLMFMLPASVKDAGTTVVVTPLVALKQDMRRRCRELGLECQEWSTRKKMHDSCILLVTPESAVSQGFMNYLRKLQVMDRLDRIVIDECHILLNTRLDFRRKLQKLRKIVEFAVQLVLLTATLPVSKESELLSMMSIEAPIIFRDRTSRHNIAYVVRRCQWEDVDSIVKEIVQRYIGNEVEGRVIVYGGGVEHCKELALAEMLECEAYFAKAGKKTEALQRWVDRETRVIVGTNALGLGIDVADVRLVVHVEVGYDLMNYGQESGRAGRDGRRSEAIVLLAEDRIMSKYKDTDHRLMWEYMLTEGCRRVKLDQFLDGNLDTVECVEGQEACDNCIRNIEVAEEVEGTQEKETQHMQETEYGVSQEMTEEMITAMDVAEYTRIRRGSEGSSR
jgi:superfamily II DNA helicase RecQ